MVCIVGNKNDKYNYQQVKKEEAEKYTQSINAVYRSVSALNSYGINELFESLGKILLNGTKKENVIPQKKVKNVTLKTKDIKKPKKGGGCCKW